MKIFNTLTKRKEEFVPLEEGKVKMYVCGPTVYNFIHIGNARPMIVFDTVRRYLEYKGYDVNYVLYCRVQKGYGNDECEAGDNPSAGDSGDSRHDRDDSGTD